MIIYLNRNHQKHKSDLLEKDKKIGVGLSDLSRTLRNSISVARPRPKFGFCLNLYLN